jgi:hypothetical protein
MAKITNGVLGPASGKIGGVVFGSWKNKNYVRAHVTPANPNTVLQQTQRTKFSLCVTFAKLLIGQCFNVYTDQFLKEMSGFNYFIKKNIARFVAEVDYANILVTEGKLYPPVCGALTWNVGDSAYESLIMNGYGSNGTSDDDVYGCLYDDVGKVMYWAIAPVKRANVPLKFELEEAGTARSFHAYIWAASLNGTKITLISNSVHLVKVQA